VTDAGVNAAVGVVVDLVALAERLPAHMVPSAVVPVAALPMTVNGKLDHAALPEPPPVTGSAATGGDVARTDTERAIAAAFAGTLGVADVGVHDDFFALGGDSIVSIQLVSRLRAAGLQVTPRDVFRHKTVAGLAAVAARAEAPPAEPPEAAWGEVPLTPVARRLVALDAPIGGYHQSMRVRLPDGATDERVEAALRAVAERHDVLRARLRGDVLEVPPPGGTPPRLLREPGVGPPFPAAREGAPLFHAVRDRGTLLLVAHHLVIDGVSWRILLDDLATAWAGEKLPPVPTSFRTWTRALHELATSPRVLAQVPYWTADVPGRTLGRRPLDPRRDTVATSRELTITLPEERTAPLLTTVPAAFHAGVDDVQLTALALALDGVRVVVETHGREPELVPGADLTRTVGWFTSEHPVWLDPGGDDPGKALKRVKEQLRAVPDRGLGHGLLRYLNPRTAPLPAAGEPEVAFNYLGRLDTGGATHAGDAGAWRPVGGDDAWGGGADPAMPVPYALEVNAVTLDGPAGPRLTATWTWPAGVLDEADVRAVATRWDAALDALARDAGGGHTPSDLDLVSLSQADIDELEAEFADLEVEP
jgi:non-ribosomal peptide synthase protein (TIGR01720 family)